MVESILQDPTVVITNVNQTKKAKQSQTKNPQLTYQFFVQFSQVVTPNPFETPFIPLQSSAHGTFHIFAYQANSDVAFDIEPNTRFPKEEIKRLLSEHSSIRRIEMHPTQNLLRVFMSAPDPKPEVTLRSFLHVEYKKDLSITHVHYCKQISQLYIRVENPPTLTVDDWSFLASKPQLEIYLKHFLDQGIPPNKRDENLEYACREAHLEFAPQWIRGNLKYHGILMFPPTFSGEAVWTFLTFSLYYFN